MTVTLINSFVVPADKEEAFVDMWKGTCDHFVNAPGFIETKLHRNIGQNDTTFLFVNVALWESVELYKAAFVNFTPAGRPGGRAAGRGDRAASGPLRGVRRDEGWRRACTVQLRLSWFDPTAAPPAKLGEGR